MLTSLPYVSYRHSPAAACRPTHLYRKIRAAQVYIRESHFATAFAPLPPGQPPSPAMKRGAGRQKADGRWESVPSGLGSGRERAFFAPQRVERAVSHLPSPICLLAASRAAALIQLVLVCASYEGRSREGQRGAGREEKRWGMGDRPFQGLGSGEKRSLFCSPASGTSGLPSPISHLSSWRPLGPPLFFNWCWCVHPMRAGAAGSLEIRLRVPPAGRMGGIVRCGCNLSLAARMAYLMYVGGRMAKSAPQIAIPPSRPATPRALTRLCLFAFSPLRLF